MALKSTRKILSFILAIIISVCTFLTGIGVLSMYTISNEKFVEKHFANNNLIEECENQLTIRYESLERQSGIPARVFDSFKTKESLQANITLAIDHFYQNQDTTLYSNSRVDNFYDKCTEYLDGNNIKYNEKYVKNVATQAAQIYSDCVGIHNITPLEKYFDSVLKQEPKIISFCVIVAVMASLLLILMYKNKSKSYICISGSVIAGGMSMIATNIIFLICKVGSTIDFSPQIYQQSFYSCTKIAYIIGIGAGIVIVGLGICGYIGANFVNKREQKRKDTRFSKRIGKF